MFYTQRKELESYYTQIPIVWNIILECTGTLATLSEYYNTTELSAYLYPVEYAETNNQCTTECDVTVTPDFQSTITYTSDLFNYASIVNYIVI